MATLRTPVEQAAAIDRTHYQPEAAPELPEADPAADADPSSEVAFPSEPSELGNAEPLDPTLPGAELPPPAGPPLRPAPTFPAAEPSADLAPLALPEGAQRAEFTGPLALTEVLTALDNLFPLLTAAEQERIIASGNVVAALGAFDLGLNGLAVAEPTGFYDNYRYGIGFEQPIANTGAKIFSGYRLGRGSYPTWYGFRETNDGGEFSLGIKQPLWQGLAIDYRRATLAQARIDRSAAEPVIRSAQVAFTQEATYAYWEWVAAGRNVQIARAMLSLAQARNKAVRTLVDAGRLGEIEWVDNNRVIYQRQAKLLAAERKLQQAALKLSLFLRLPDGQPIVPVAEQLPADFPPILPPDSSQAALSIQFALDNRPEIRELSLLRQRLQVELNLAENMLLPSLDLVLRGSQDVGGQTKGRDKQEFETEAGLQLDVPLQRRAAQGKARAIRAKIAQVSLKLQMVRDKVVVDVQDAYSALQAAHLQWLQASAALDAAREVERRERIRFEGGGNSILQLNLREQATADAATLVVEAQALYFDAEAAYLAALGVTRFEELPQLAPVAEEVRPPQADLPLE